MPQQSQTVVDIMRHGEPVGGRMYRGHRDDPLSERGWQQMQQATKDYQAWDVIVTSPLQRCAGFAEQIAQQQNKPLELDDRFKEIHWGAWEGLTPLAICRDDPNTLHRFHADPSTLRPQGAEDIDVFRQRIISAWQDLLGKHRNQHILLVAHAGVIRAIISMILDSPAQRMFNIAVANAAITRVRVEHLADHDRHHLVFHNGVLRDLNSSANWP